MVSLGILPVRKICGMMRMGRALAALFSLAVEEMGVAWISGSLARQPAVKRRTGTI
jgi:hypothetical protein